MNATTNPMLGELIDQLKKKSLAEKLPIWKRIALDLERPTRIRRSVNLYHIEKSTRKGEIAIVPGKVLGVGHLTRPIVVAAFQFSNGALQKVAKSGGKCIYFGELIRELGKGKKMRIIG